MRKIQKLAALFLCFVFITGSCIIPSSAAIKFNVSDDTLRSQIAKYSVSVNVNNNEQRFSIKASDITQIRIRSKKQSKTKMVVKSVVYIDREVATVKGNVTTTYSLKNNKWKLSNVAYTSTALSAIHLKGNWSGTYEQNRGHSKLDLSVGGTTADGFATDAVFAFSATPTSPSIPSGSYTLKGGADKTTGLVTLEGDLWIDQPEGYVFVDIHGYVDLVNKTIRDDTHELVISKN